MEIYVCELGEDEDPRSLETRLALCIFCEESDVLKCRLGFVESLCKDLDRG